MANSTTTLANLAIQEAGGSQYLTTTLASDTSVAASAVSTCLSALRQATLRENPWLFSITRASLTLTSATAYTANFTSKATIPTGCLRLLPPDRFIYSRRPDWTLEGTKILTNSTGTIEVRYVTDVTDVTKWDTLFYAAMAKRIAWNITEKITGSATKRQILWKEFEEIIAMARMQNAIERAPPQDSYEDDWVTVRNQGSVAESSKYLWFPV